MPLTCPKCQRLNPEDALYCYNDGLALRAYQAPVAANRLTRPFVFPSGRHCHTFDELVDACLDNWEESKEFVKGGMFAGFLGGLGRADLARAAYEAEKNPDPDRGLDDLLARLPSSNVPGPVLRVQTAEIDLGTLSPGEDSQFDVRIKNQGRGLLHGSVSSEDCYWIALGSAAGQKQKLFQTLNEEVIKVHVRGKSLRAGNKPLETTLSIQSSGGVETVTIKARVPVKPFPDGALAGAMTPRQVAEKSKAHAKEAIPLFESGAVARWYESNGWTYPVQGPTASGLGAVQQFFEALGLTPAPKLEINQKAMTFRAGAGEDVTQTVQVSTPDKKPVYAYGKGDKPWVTVGKAKMSGRTADLPIQVHVPEESRKGETLDATLVLTGNGNQKFIVPISVSVTSGPVAPAVIPIDDLPPVVPIDVPPLPVAAYIPPPPPPIPITAAKPAYSLPPVATATPLLGVTAASPSPYQEVVPLEDAVIGTTTPREPFKKERLLPWAPVAFMALALLVTFVRDLNTKPPPPDGGRQKNPFEFQKKDPVQLVDLHFHDKREVVSLGRGGAKENTTGEQGRYDAWWEPSMRFGLTTRPDSSNPEEEARSKKLTFYDTGMTNNAIVRIDGKESIYGERPFSRKDNGQLVDDKTGKFAGRWRDRKTHETLPDNRMGRRSTWEYPEQQIAITQQVELIVGQSGDHDTVLVHYEIENEGSRDRRVGLRFLLDTFIGNNDGVPFLLPGVDELVNTTHRFDSAEEVPAFIQALERGDKLKDPGTICQIGLKVDGLENPNRVTLNAYPDVQLNRRDPRCLQEKTMWEVPVFSIQTIRPADSSVVMYWDEKPLAPGKKRLVGFTYGLGYLASKQGEGKLALTAGGSFVPDGEITVTAYVQNPTPGMEVTLTLPEGFDFDNDSAKKRVPPLPRGSASNASPVTWKIKAGSKTGEFQIQAESGKLKESHSIVIRPRRLFGS